MIQNSAADSPKQASLQEIRPQAFECSGGLRTAVIVAAVAYTEILWLQAFVAALTASGMVAGVTTYNVLGMLLLPLLIVTYVVTGLWLQRARRNADRIAPNQQRLSRVWVWLGWIVPIVSFWFPRQLVDDVWRSTVRDPAEPETGWWWGTWLIALVPLNWLSVLLATGGASWVVGRLLVAIAMTVAGVFWIDVVRTVSDAQDALAGHP